MTQEHRSAQAIAAEAVNTVHWLAHDVATVAVPVYQRAYRWDMSECQRLLDDVRTIADAPDGRSHFIGSILATSGADNPSDLTLVDGQQRLTTLTLLTAALHATVASSGVPWAATLQRILSHPTRRAGTKLVMQREQVAELAAVVFDSPSTPYEPGSSALRDNYEFFLRELDHDPERVWRGMGRLEHVFVSLTDSANPQQVFASLNSAGAPLRNHELIHNYVLMGLPHNVQQDIEETYWDHIERNTGDSLDSFFRDYLILRTGRDSEFRGEHGIYEEFKSQFGELPEATLRPQAEEWKSLSEIYEHLLDPRQASDPEIARHLGYVNVFGTSMYPIVMAIHSDYMNALIDRAAFLDALTALQSLYLRRMVVGETRDHLAAQLCRQRNRSADLTRAIARRTPTDERVRVALRTRSLPHAGYVLQRLQAVKTLKGIEIEHIFPQGPADTWSGGGDLMWASFTEESRAQHRELLNTLGNLTLLEQPLNAGASNRSFPDKQGNYYNKSAIEGTRSLVGERSWDAMAIAQRTHDLTEVFLKTWPRPIAFGTSEAEFLVPILDAERKPGWYQGWRTEFEYVRFGNEIWEIRNVKELFSRVYKRLWATNRDAVLAYSTAHDGPAFAEKAWNGQWDALGDSHYLFMGLFPQYMLGSTQRILDELGIADDVLIKYSSDGDGA